MEIITSKQNQIIKHLRHLRERKYREFHQEIVVEGEHLIEECLRQHLVKRILLTEQETDIYHFPDTLWISEAVADSLSMTTSGSRSFAVVAFPHYPLDQPRKLILCDGIQDPGNMGTIIRTAYSFGFDGVVCSESCVDCFNDKVIRSSQGAVFEFPVLRESLKERISALIAEGIRVIGTDVRQGTPLAEVPNDHVAFVVGNEGQGVSEEVLALCNGYTTIETVRFESLNVAIATAILCYHCR